MSHATHRRQRAAIMILAVVLPAGLVGWAAVTSAFSRATLDIGVVVSDIDKSVNFYKNTLGFTEVKGFHVPASLGRDAGLSDNQPLHVHVMVLGKEKSATRLKLMQFKNAPGKKVDNAYIHSSYGVSYLSVFVTDLTATLQRAARDGVRPIAKGPVAIGGDRFLAIVRDPDGNLIELIGPKAK